MTAANCAQQAAKAVQASVQANGVGPGAGSTTLLRDEGRSVDKPERFCPRTSMRSRTSGTSGSTLSRTTSACKTRASSMRCTRLTRTARSSTPSTPWLRTPCVGADTFMPCSRRSSAAACSRSLGSTRRSATATRLGEICFRSWNHASVDEGLAFLVGLVSEENWPTELP